jgi:hypothetical protein
MFPACGKLAYRRPERYVLAVRAPFVKDMVRVSRSVSIPAHPFAAWLRCALSELPNFTQIANAAMRRGRQAFR